MALYFIYQKSLDHRFCQTELRNSVCGKLVTVTSRSDSDFERSNVSLKENKPDGVDPNSYDLDYCIRKNDEKILWFSAD